MERTMFTEMNQNELMETEGGAAHILVIGIIAIVSVVAGVGAPIVVNDMRRSYELGYNEVMSSANQAYQTVSSGDSR